MEKETNLVVFYCSVINLEKEVADAWIVSEDKRVKEILGDKAMVITIPVTYQDSKLEFHRI